MDRITKYLFSTLALITIFTGVTSCSESGDEVFSDTIKVSMRDVGHQLLLSNRDSTSLVKPVIVLNESKFELQFDSDLEVQPDTLVAIVRRSFQKAELPSNYLVEVIRCEDGEVAYSYKMKQDIEKGIVPCAGRTLSMACYTITIRFTKTPTQAADNSIYPYLIGFVVLGVIALLFFRRNGAKAKDKNYETLGRYKFYPEQNKLIKEAIEIGLSKKECELLALLVAQPNQIIKRDVLTKKIWEDKGVVVGRSLDTYISKLRKKLKDDESIKITNVHGVGYKLEIS